MEIFSIPKAKVSSVDGSLRFKLPTSKTTSAAFAVDLDAKTDLI
jgi:hypothetical protein